MKCFFKELVNAIIVGIAIFAVFLAIAYVKEDTLDFDQKLLLDFGINMVYSITLYAVNRIVFMYYYNKYTVKKFCLQHLTYFIIAGILVTLATIFVLNGLLFYFVRDIPLSQFLSSQRPADYWVSLLISVVVTTIFYGIFYYRYKKEVQVKEQQIIAGGASAQLDALMNQLDPHFLFNSLNVLTSLIEEDQQKAMLFTTSLSKVYRYVLEQKNKILVPLEEELAFAKTYLDLLKMRFEESLIVTLPDHVVDQNAKVVPLSLQLLLENAVKHNRVTQSDKLYITIFEKNGYLIVENNQQPKQIINRGSGVGLYNIKSRYALLCTKEVKVTNGPSLFKVGIPILTQEVQYALQPETYNSDKRYARAQKHVAKLKEFYVHLFIYLIAVPFFIILNLISTSFPWSLFPITGWGMGVVFHAVAVFEWNPFFNKSWEERHIKRLMEKENEV